MKAKYLLSLDLGGSGGRALLFDTEQMRLHFQTCRWEFSLDKKAGDYAFDLGCQERWHALCQLVKQALGEHDIDPQDVAGISVTSMRHGMVLLDRGGEVLLATPNKDARAVSESMELLDEYGEQIYQHTGHLPVPILLAARLMWVKNNFPEYLSDENTVMTISDWMAFKLSGEKFSDPTQAAETGLFDLKTSDWARDMIHNLGLPVDIFPDIVWPGTRIGQLTQTAADALGLVAGIPIAAGGADTQLGLLGLGICGPNEVGIIAGSTAPVMVTTNQLEIDPNQRTWTGMFPLPGIYVVESNAGNMGGALEWIANILYCDSPDPIAALSGDAKNSAPGATGIISNLGTQLFNAAELSIPVDSLTFSTMTAPTGASGRSGFAQAILGGMAFSIRQNTEQALSITGLEPHRIYLSGGMTRSTTWNQIVADTFNLPVTIGYDQHVTAFGAVLCAAVGSGMYNDLTTAVESLVKDSQIIKPGDDATYFHEHYETWKEHQQERVPADEIAAGIILNVMQSASGKDSADQISFRPNIFISANAGTEAVNLLSELGEVTYQPYSEAGIILMGEELAEVLEGYHVLVTEVDLVDADTVQKANDLRVVVVCRGNPVNVDIDACTAAGIPVINTPGRNADAVADLTVSFMLMLVRKLDKASLFLRQPGGEAGDMGRMGQAYFTLKGNELWNKHIGVIGGGAIGKRVIKRLHPFGAHLLVYDPYLSAEDAALIGARKVTLSELLSQSDLITLHAPVTEETTAMINEDAFKHMKPGVYLINTARAALVDYDALIHALETGQLGGAAIDVFPVEPPGSDDPLLAFENVIATPHIGGNTSEVGIHQGRIIVEELTALLSGKAPRFALNPEALGGFNWHQRGPLDQRKLAELAKGPGPGMTDIDLKNKQLELEKIKTDEPVKTSSIIGRLTKLVRGRDVEEPSPSITTTSGISPGDTRDSNDRTKVEKHYAEILEAFLQDLANDPDTQTFAAKKNVSFEFELKNTGITFFMHFIDSTVNAAIGSAPFKTDVKVKMDADTFDGMFSGRIDGTQAFKSGKLSVSGNMLKAMTMQKLNFGPLYEKARDAIGGPGDLSLLSSPASSAPSPEVKTQPEIKGSGFDVFLRIIQHFVELMQNDPDTIEFSKKKNVTFQYIIKDAGITFYTGFTNGDVKTGMGESPEKADVIIKTDASTLDGMFNGTLDGTAAFKSGKLSVSGNMMKAMVMQKLNYQDLYIRARNEVGDPGDLGRSTPVQTGSEGRPSIDPADSAVSLTVPQVIRKTGDIRDTLLEINNELYQRGWITSTGGNISTRTEDNPNEIWITPSGLFKGDLHPEMMVRIDLDGNIIGDAPFNASSERKVHCAIFQKRSEINAVIHTHAFYATLMALTGIEWLPISTDAAFFGQIPVVPFIMPGSSELGDEVATAIGREGVAVIMQNHGLVVAGSDLRRAADTTEAIELTAEKLLWCQKLGVTPPTLPEDVVDILKDMGSMMA